MGSKLAGLPQMNTTTLERVSERLYERAAQRLGDPRPCRVEFADEDGAVRAILLYEDDVRGGTWALDNLQDFAGNLRATLIAPGLKPLRHPNLISLPKEEAIDAKLVCSVSYIVEGTEALPPCPNPVVKRCEKCGSSFCKHHAEGSMVGNLCFRCAEPGAVKTLLK